MKHLIIAAGLIFSAPVFAQTTSQTTAPNTGGMTHISVTCSTTSTPFGVAGSQYLTVQVPTTAAQVVFFGWGGIATNPTTATSADNNSGASQNMPPAMMAAIMMYVGA